MSFTFTPDGRKKEKGEVKLRSMAARKQGVLTVPRGWPNSWDDPRTEGGKRKGGGGSGKTDLTLPLARRDKERWRKKRKGARNS